MQAQGTGTMLTEVLFLVLAAAPLVYLYSTRTYGHWKKRKIPFVKPVPLFGNMLDVILVRRSLAEITEKIYRKGAGQPVIGFFQFQKPVLLLRDPEVIKAVMVKEFSSFHDNSFIVDETLDPLAARNPFFQKGEKWKAVRSLLTPAFTIGKIKPQLTLMEPVCKDLIDFIEKESFKGNPDGIEAKELAAKFTTDIVATCAFGIEGNSLKYENAELRNKGRDLLSTSMWNKIKFMILFFLPSLGKFLKARIKETVSYREENNVIRNDYLNMLVQIKNKGRIDDDTSIIRVGGVNLEYTEEDITAHALTFFIDGFETSSVALSFALYELALNPEVQTKLRMEVDSVLKKHNGKLCYEAIQEMIYLDMVLSESLRIHPPAIATDRICNRTCELSLPNGDNVVIEKGFTVLIPIEALHKDPEHFPQPDKFNPERFSEEQKASIKRYTYIPFGEGPRQCLGIKFGLTQIKVGLATIVSQFEICRSPKTPVPLILDILSFFPIAKGGLWLDFVKRTDLR
ncbi:cytochrome P450 6k1 [Anabrus simplex]|uniref:cytochrome P450 6k1 n=1 Tax=Anabrus simplex TaxID=316456 RepID=UPI0035A2DF3E